MSKKDPRFIYSITQFFYCKKYALTHFSFYYEACLMEKCYENSQRNVFSYFHSPLIAHLRIAHLRIAKRIEARIESELHEIDSTLLNLISFHL